MCHPQRACGPGAPLLQPQWAMGQAPRVEGGGSGSAVVCLRCRARAGLTAKPRTARGSCWELETVGEDCSRIGVGVTPTFAPGTVGCSVPRETPDTVLLGRTQCLNPLKPPVGVGREGRAVRKENGGWVEVWSPHPARSPCPVCVRRKFQRQQVAPRAGLGGRAVGKCLHWGSVSLNTEALCLPPSPSNARAEWRTWRERLPGRPGPRNLPASSLSLWETHR